MNQVAELRLPVEMDAHLAELLSSAFVAERARQPVADYLGLTLAYVSWTQPSAFTMASYAEELRKLESVNAERLLDGLAEPTVYLSKPESADRGNDERRMLVALTARLAAQLKTEQRRLPVIQSVARQCVESLLKADARMGSLIARRIRAALETAGYVCNPLRTDDEDEPADAGKSIAQALLANTASGPRILMVPRQGANGQALGVLQMLQQLGLVAPDASGHKPEAKTEETTALAEPGADEYRVFDPKEAADAVAKLPASMMPAADGNARLRSQLEAMAGESGVRALSQVPADEPLASLEERFPHFKDVIDFVRTSLALAGCGAEGRPVRIAPMLLRGEPGTGKTYFAQELARVLGTHFVERDLSVTSEAFVISGMDSVWKNAKPGVVFEALVNGKTANPVINLNEVDKAHVTGTHNSPLAPMYALLEPTSSATFTDEFVPVRLDASRIVWVLTANDGPIPEPILSRLEVFDIKPPTKEQCRQIAASVWESVLSRTMPRGHGFEETLSEELLEFMSSLSPRSMRKALTNAASRAALDGRKRVELSDLQAAWKRYAPVTKVLGFTA